MNCFLCMVLQREPLHNIFICAGILRSKSLQSWVCRARWNIFPRQWKVESIINKILWRCVSNIVLSQSISHYLSWFWYILYYFLLKFTLWSQWLEFTYKVLPAVMVEMESLWLYEMNWAFELQLGYCVYRSAHLCSLTGSGREWCCHLWPRRI